MRQLSLQINSTAIKASEERRIVEIRCVEIIEGRIYGCQFQKYINPECEVAESDQAIHGISNELLDGKPVFRDIMDEFIEFIRDAELIFHNAVTEVNLLDYELTLANCYYSTGYKYIKHLCSVVDVLWLARKRYPGKNNDLDVLQRRFGIKSIRKGRQELLSKAETLAQVYLLMTFRTVKYAEHSEDLELIRKQDSERGVFGSSISQKASYIEDRLFFDEAGNKLSDYSREAQLKRGERRANVMKNIEPYSK